ncbi:MAG: hypothetical protein IPL26_16860 [Leptospiraceae bacterium]|nr:hypothetical protein [Leptospiraceae bacterium]
MLTQKKNLLIKSKFVVFLTLFSFIFVYCNNNNKTKGKITKEEQIAVMLAILNSNQNQNAPIPPSTTNSEGTNVSALVLATIARNPEIVFKSLLARENGQYAPNPIADFFECAMFKKISIRIAGVETNACPTMEVAVNNKATREANNNSLTLENWVKTITEATYKTYIEPNIKNTVDNFFRQTNEFISSVFKAKDGIEAVSNSLQQISGIISNIATNPLLAGGLAIIGVAILSNLIAHNGPDPAIMSKLEEISSKLDRIESQLIEIYSLITLLQDQVLSIPVIESLNKIKGIKEAYNERLKAKDYDGAKKIAEKYADDPSVFFEAIYNILHFGEQRVTSAIQNRSLQPYQVKPFYVQEYRHVGYTYYSCYIFATCSNPVWDWVTVEYFYLNERNSLGTISFIDFSRVLIIMMTYFQFQEAAYYKPEEKSKLKSLQIETIASFRKKILPLKVALENNFQNKVVTEISNTTSKTYERPESYSLTSGYVHARRLYGTTQQTLEADLKKEAITYHEINLEYEADLVSFLIYLNALDIAWQSVK